MKTKTLSIGSSGECDMNLTSFSRCQFVSEKHACIFYDDDSKSYELINYSCHGTIVDGVLYSLDVSRETQIKGGNGGKKTPPNGSLVKLIDINNKKPTRMIQRLKSQEDTVMPLRPSGGNCNKEFQGVKSMVPVKNKCITVKVCRCSDSPSSSSMASGFEGPAILKHGSIIKFGCLLFVFSIVSKGINGFPVKAVSDAKRKRTSSDSNVTVTSSSLSSIT
jgi:pSer/pThr/pTyr-binding forkhead associated (FHA) protein